MIGDNTWEIIEHFDQPSNQKILSALEGGSQAISLELSKPLSSEETIDLFENIDLSIIRLYLDGSSDGIRSVLNDQMHATVPFHLLKDLNDSGANLNFHIFSFRNENFKEEALTFLEKAKSYLHLPLTITYPISNKYLENIIHLRVIRLLWEHIKQSTDELKVQLSIVAKTDYYPSESKVEQDLIYASIHLMSAIIGSADGIHLKVSDKEGHSAAFKHRIFRNLHLLTSYEGKMDQISDPLRGSYYIEKETLAIAEEVWEKFTA